jgi:hypothetical protein
MSERHVPPVATGLAAEVQRAVRERAKLHGLHAAFGEGRRASDVTLVVVKGDRVDVLRHAPGLFEGLGVDQEVVRSSQMAESFELVVALMLPRERRRPRDGAERRASELVDEE